jgi:hypothetical protein
VVPPNSPVQIEYTHRGSRTLEEEGQALQKKLVTSHEESSVAQERKRLATSQYYWQKKQERLQQELNVIYSDYGHGGAPFNMRDLNSAMESLRKASESKQQEIKSLEQHVIDLETVCRTTLCVNELFTFLLIHDIRWSQNYSKRLPDSLLVSVSWKNKIMLKWMHSLRKRMKL